MDRIYRINGLLYSSLEFYSKVYYLKPSILPILSILFESPFYLIKAFVQHANRFSEFPDRVFFRRRVVGQNDVGVEN
jgi:hypothetical protein